MSEGDDSGATGSPRGQELLAQRARLLAHLYNQGAVGFSSAAEYADLDQWLRLDDRGTMAVIESAQSAGLLEISGAAVKFEGTSYRPARFWLSGRGFDEAARLAAAVRDQGVGRPKRRLGFREPGEEEGET